MRLFHYHLVTSRVREVEARYLAKLGFELVARYGRVGEEHTSYEPGISWDELDRLGFKLRLAELERGAVNIVVQPGQWDLPRVDHIGIALEEDDFAGTLARADQLKLRVQEHGGRRTFVTTGADYRVELHPPRDWLEELLAEADALSIGELQMRADDPFRKTAALADLLDVPHRGSTLEVGETVVRFVDGGPVGRPELHAELFV